MNKHTYDIVENKISKYTEPVFPSGPVSVSQYNSEKFDRVHTALYTDALTRYISESFTDDDPSSDYRFIEIKPSDFRSPSKVLVVSRKTPYPKKYVDLTPWWGTYVFGSIPDWSHIKINSRYGTSNAAIININYQSGKVTLRDNMSGVTFNVPFDRINGDTPVDPSLGLNETFAYKYINGNDG